MPEKETSEKPEKPPWSPVPESKAGKAAFFFSQLVSYFLLAANFRAIAKGYYLYTACPSRNWGRTGCWSTGAISGS
jgi:hypothetical protein